ncbi:hypothetical protein B566_EDAN016123 [Ephemera danica]|nr:hypothetical protein B566_EDAN016123 [Ephemera danica]
MLIGVRPRSKSCPQCRKSTNENKVIKIYLNISEQGSQEDAAQLIQNNDALTLELHTNKKELNNVTAEKKKLENELSEKVVQLCAAEDKLLTLESQNSAYRKHLKNNKKLEERLAELRKAKEKADNEIQAYKKSLAVFCSALKRQLNDMELKCRNAKKKELYQNSMLQKVRERADKLESDMKDSTEVIKKLEEENESLKKKVQKMKESLMTPNLSHAKDKMLTRLLQESPMPDTLLENSADTSSPEVVFLSTGVSRPPQKKLLVHSHLKASSTVTSNDKRQPLASKLNTASGSKDITSRGALASFNQSSKTSVKSTVPKPSFLLGSTRMSRLASNDTLQKRLYQTARKDVPDGMVYNGLGGTVRAEQPIPSKKKFLGP